MSLFRRLLRKIFIKRHCNHAVNYYHMQYRAKDGTPMVYFRCYDCGYEDRGHVYANEWPELFIKDTRNPENNFPVNP